LFTASSTITTPETAFAFFLKLPKELRLDIWRHAIQNRPSRKHPPVLD
jgi:hypothetical protein